MISQAGIDRFFDRYASMMNDALLSDVNNVRLIMNSFSDFVVGSNPHGVFGGKNDDQFAEAIHQGIDFYKKIGIVSMNVVAKRTTILDNFHALVRVSWTSFYRNDDVSGDIPFEVAYMMQYRNHALQIFAYVTGDEQAAFKAHKLISESGAVWNTVLK
jgi:hypothetical protein